MSCQAGLLPLYDTAPEKTICVVYQYKVHILSPINGSCFSLTTEGKWSKKYFHDIVFMKKHGSWPNFQLIAFQAVSLWTRMISVDNFFVFLRLLFFALLLLYVT